MSKPSTEAKAIAKTIAKLDPALDTCWSAGQAIVRRFNLVGQMYSDLANVTDAGAWAASTGRMSAEQGRKLLALPIAAFVQIVLDIRAIGEVSNQERANAWMAA